MLQAGKPIVTLHKNTETSQPSDAIDFQKYLANSNRSQVPSAGNYCFFFFLAIFEEAPMKLIAQEG